MARGPLEIFLAGRANTVSRVPEAQEPLRWRLPETPVLFQGRSGALNTNYPSWVGGSPKSPRVGLTRTHSVDRIPGSQSKNLV